MSRAVWIILALAFALGIARLAWASTHAQSPHDYVDPAALVIAPVIVGAMLWRR